jgi:UDP-glucuronate 4-epimerase
MAPFLFADAILNDKPIRVFNHGDMLRDFTYIDDIVEGVIHVLDKPATPSSHVNTVAPYRLFNIGNNQPEQLMDFIGLLEHTIGKKAQKEFLPMQAGDVKATYADTSALEAWVGFKPNTPLKLGVEKFVAWYRQYYKI